MGTLCRERTEVKRKRYSRKFQRMAVERLRMREDAGEWAQELGMTRDVFKTGARNSKQSNHAKMGRGPAQTRRPTVSKPTS